jgi:D-sedoheptulose 7-phosphate isomerase
MARGNAGAPLGGAAPRSASAYLAEFGNLLIGMVATGIGGLDLDLDSASDTAIEQVRNVVNTDGKVILVGNGGSAAVASHMHNDLCKAAQIRALVFTEQPLLTAYSNDDGYDMAFGTLTNLWVEAEDVVIAISSSGASENILRVCEVAKKARAFIITMSGFSETNPLRTTGEINFYVGSTHYGYVETAHAALGHHLTDAAAGLLTNGDSPE